ncbi:hypothetical protein F5Y14DRAFT_119457 [Nemania sp. NC0429]|nr:hypothetical protein F5Y14DRAFT_119457 [Nemania sp. NC0429]
MGANLNSLLCGLVLLLAVVSSSPVPLGPVPSIFQKNDVSRRELPPSAIQHELGPRLSSGSLIILPSDTSFFNLTERWNTLAPPDIQVAIQPAQESDIPTIVKYCNNNSLKFMAVNTGHGFTTTLGKFKGVQIDLKQLRGSKIAADGKSALLQGGSYFHDVVPKLWDNGYVTATGAAECVGIAGPALGGGHGRYEGMYGLVSDNLIHLNVVLADGSAIGVNETSHADLFWAMRGAGHNFGIVTSMKLKIYPKKVPTWHYHNYVWSQDKLEQVFKQLNKIQDNGKAPPKLGVSYGMVHINSTVSKTEPILFWTFGYAGPRREAEDILRPFNKIGAISEEMGDVSYPDLIYPQLTSQDTDCGDGSYAVSTTMTKTWNITTERQNYKLYTKNLAKYPDLASTSLLFYEGYSVKAAQAIPSDSTAYPHRDRVHLSIFQTTVPEKSDLRAPAEAWAKAHWDLWNAGQPGTKPATYVNYANGLPYQTLESIYGYEPWRLSRLRSLKAKYDPKNSFRYYNPIIAS